MSFLSVILRVHNYVLVSIFIFLMYIFRSFVHAGIVIVFAILLLCAQK